MNPLNPIREDLVNRIIKNHYSKNKNFNLEEIKKYFSEKNNVFLDDEVLKKRIENIKNEIEKSHK
jgi:hypothetical protein